MKYWYVHHATTEGGTYMENTAACLSKDAARQLLAVYRERGGKVWMTYESPEERANKMQEE